MSVFSSSYSSVISPTISSRMSSMVTIPAVPPNSSTTITRCTRLSCISFSSSSTGLESGHQTGLRIMRADPLGGLGVRLVVDPLDHVLEVEHADHVVQPVADHRDAAEAGAQRQRDRLAQGLVLLDEHHVGPRHHHLAHDRVAEVEDRVDHPALAGLDHLAGLGQVDQLAQLGLGRERAVAEPLARGQRVADQDQQPGEGAQHGGHRDQRAGQRAGHPFARAAGRGSAARRPRRCRTPRSSPRP